MTNARWRPRLAEALNLIADAAPAFEDEWWILGSAAAALSGADILEVRDVDLLLSERDARDLLARWSERRTEAVATSDQFRSTVFARFEDAPLPIDVFGEFEMRVRGDWRRIHPLTRERRGAVFTPSVAEQIAILEAMDRDKDKARIAALSARL
jgi:hypothetical protein